MTATARVDGTPARPGATVTAVLSVAIAAPFHVAAPLIGVTLSSDLKLDAGEAQISEPTLAKLAFDDAPSRIHEGRLEVRVPLHVRADAPPGSGKIRIGIRYQACDDRRCLAPAEIAAEAELTIAP